MEITGAVIGNILGYCFGVFLILLVFQYGIKLLKKSKNN